MSAQIFRSVDDARGNFGPCVIAIGNFDGVHLGHRALLDKVVEHASHKRLLPAALTFHPHPTAVVARERTPKLICSLKERLRLLELAGAERIVVLPFTAAVAAMSPEEFVSQILVNSLQVGAVVVGEGFRFGYRQSGSADTLRELGVQYGFDSQFLTPVTCRGEIVSSSAIRAHVAEHRIPQAARLLGRWFSLEGPVVPGQGIGSKQTVPTLNLQPKPGQTTPRGVYITETQELLGDRRWPSITNVGVRPTFAGDELTIETFLLGPFGGETPTRIRVHFRRFVRHERQFPDPAALKQQIFRDVARAQAYWRHAGHLRSFNASLY